MVKYADDITISVLVKMNSDTALAEVMNVKNWIAINNMSLNMSKTWEMIVRGNTAKSLPPQLSGINRKEWLKLLGITFQADQGKWDLHIDSLLSRAGSRMYIPRVCKLILRIH